MDAILPGAAMPARTQRFLRERGRPAAGDEDLRYWLRVRAVFAVAGASVMFSLILWAGLGGTAPNGDPAPLAQSPGSAATSTEQ
jgi:hypothetical protein